MKNVAKHCIVELGFVNCVIVPLLSFYSFKKCCQTQVKLTSLFIQYLLYCNLSLHCQIQAILLNVLNFFLQNLFLVL